MNQLRKEFEELKIIVSYKKIVKDEDSVFK